MLPEESIQTRQNNEFEALKGIYVSELKDLRKKAAWNKWVPMNLSISLGPSHSSSRSQEDHVSVDLLVNCSEQYPKKAPKLSLENGKGLSDNLLFQLKDELEKKAKELEGEEMIFQMCQHVQEFLYTHNKPAPKSFYEEMMKRNKEMEQKALEAQKQEKDKDLKTTREEILQRKEFLKTEEPLIRNQVKFQLDELEEGYEGVSESTSLQYSNKSSEDLPCDIHVGLKYINFSNIKQVVQRCSCRKHLNENCIIYCCVDESGKILCLTEWKISKTDNDETMLDRTIASIQAEVNNKLTELKHVNLCSYIGLQYLTESEYVFVNVLSEFISGSNSTLLIRQGCPTNIQQVKHIAEGVIAALNCLHRNHIVHKDLTLSCIHLSEEGIVKVSNYSIYKRLSALVCSSREQINYSKKADIYRFGVILLSLLNGSPVNEDDVNIPSNLPPDLYDFLQKCLCKKQVRSLAHDLMKHKFLQDEIISMPLRSQDRLPESTPEQIAELKRVLKMKLQVCDEGRIKTQFYVMEQLGKGAFGYVFKAKNIIDGNCYAVKIIQLNANKKNLIKKILREVNLLSRLNHENIVRYYNSWIEAVRPLDKSLPHAQGEDTVSGDHTDSGDNLKLASNQDQGVVVVHGQSESVLGPTQDTDDEDDDEEDDDYDDDEDEDEEDDDYDDEEENNVNFENDDSSFVKFEEGPNEPTPTSEEFILFKENEKDGVEKQKDLPRKNDQFEKSKESQSDSRSPNKCKPRKTQDLIQNMYIQMEFCEKSTLRTAIDNKLHKEGDRIWRLFREIVEGIAYIHEQGMMHRDLKPDNIFLDSKGHVKIGDFGLATHIVNRKLEVEEPRTDSEKEYPEDERKTGAIGTALYVAPELTNASRVSYNEKVDIYSLGIILFEMCHPPLNTGMERVKIITAVRSKEVIFPKEFERKDNEKQRLVIRWLLNHDTSKRPSSRELVESEHLPPPALEEREMRDLVRRTLSNPRSKSYKYLVSSCFRQSVSDAQNIMYDHDPSLVVNMEVLQHLGYVKQIVRNVCKQFGAVELSTTLLMPKCTFYEQLYSHVTLMSRYGGIMSLPHDLRIPFARYIAWHGLTSFRRYVIERVYRYENIVGFQPLESWECAFDIVTPSAENCMADAEVLCILYEILQTLKMESICLIRLNHTSLFDAVLIKYDLLDKRDELIDLFCSMQEGVVDTNKLQDCLVSYGLPNRIINPLLNYFNSDNDLENLPNMLKQMKRKCEDVGYKTTKSLEQLNTIVKIVKEFGATIDMVLAPGLLYKAEQYDGIMFQVVCGLKKKHKFIDVIATGGRYDAAVNYYRQIMVSENMLSEDVKPSAVGISISLDKLCHIINMESEEDKRKLSIVDVVVCSLGNKRTMQEKVKVLKSLRSAGIRSSLIECASDEEARDHCIELRARYAVLLKNSEPGSVRIRAFDKERVCDKPVEITELVESLTRILRLGVNSDSQSNYELLRSDSKSSSHDRNEQSRSTNVVVYFIEKLPANTRKRLENQVKNELDGLLMRLKGAVVIIVINAEIKYIEIMAKNLNFASDDHYQASRKKVLERHPKYKKDLENLCEEVYLQKKKWPQAVIILYSLPDTSYNLIV